MRNRVNPLKKTRPKPLPHVRSPSCGCSPPTVFPPCHALLSRNAGCRLCLILKLFLYPIKHPINPTTFTLDLMLGLINPSRHTSTISAAGGCCRPRGYLGRTCFPWLYRQCVGNALTWCQHVHIIFIVKFPRPTAAKSRKRS